MTLGELLRHTAERYPAQEAIVCGPDRMTYHTVDCRASQLAWHLAEKGIMPGDRIALLLKNSPIYMIAYFGVLKAGAVVVPLNPDAGMHELKDILIDCAPRGIVCHVRLLALVAPLIDGLADLTLILTDAAPRSVWQDRRVRIELIEELFREENTTADPHPGGYDDLAQILYTSGTTGRPKGIMLTHRNLVANTRAIVSYLKLSVQDRLLVILPFFYSYGNSLLLTHAYVGATLVVADQFVFLNKVVAMMVQEEVTGFSGVPYSYALLLRQSVFPKTRFGALRYVTCAGGALGKQLIKELQAALPETEIYIMYGQTEAAARLSYLAPSDLTTELGSIGKGIPGVILRVIGKDGNEVSPGEIGEVVAEGENIMAGYWNDPELTRRVLKGNTLHTGDMATIDEKGFIFIVGRRSNIIKYGSYRIHPEEIERVLDTYPDVVENAVIGVDDELLGESIVAFVSLRPGSAGGKRDLLQHARQFLPMYKIPQRIVFVDQLPKTSSGKVKHGLLRERYQARDTISEYPGTSKGRN